MKKRILAAAMCAVAVLSFTGCKGDADKFTSQINNNTANNNTNNKNDDDERPSNTSKPTSSANSSANSGGATSSAGGTSKPSNDPESLPAFEEPDYSKDFSWSTAYDDYYQPIGISITKYKGSDEDVIIPEEINGQAVVWIGSGCFKNNIDIVSVTIPASVTAIASGAFSDCLNLDYVMFMGDVPYFDLDTFKNTPWLEMSLAMNTDPNLTIVEGVLIKANTDIEGDVVIPNGVTLIGYEAFYNCTKITSVTIPDSVTEIGSSAFEYCNKLKSVTLPKGLTVINSEVFYGCSSLENVDIPYGVTTIGSYSFTSCPATVNVPDTVIYDYGSNIRTAVFKGETYDSSSSYMHYHEYLNAVDQNRLAQEFGDEDYVITNGVLMKVRPDVTAIELPDTVIDIDDKAFNNCFNIIIITFKGKKYNLSNLEKLKEAVRGEG